MNLIFFTVSKKNKTKNEYIFNLKISIYIQSFFFFTLQKLANQISPFRRYTVNGYPCKNGTICQQNEITGFWSCETENEHGSWDYCCEPNHQCGFSQGYHYPWYNLY